METVSAPARRVPEPAVRELGVAVLAKALDVARKNSEGLSRMFALAAAAPLPRGAGSKVDLRA